MSFDVAYLPRTGPFVQRIAVRNDGAESIDLDGWQVRDTRSGRTHELWAVTLDSSMSFVIDFAGPGGAPCPPSGPRYVHWCRLLDLDRISVVDTEQLWSGGPIELLDPAGDLHATWTPPT